MLDADSIHLWQINLAQQPMSINIAKMLLSPSELERATQFKFVKDQQRYIVSHATVRRILAHYLHQKPQALQFRYGEYGKPSIKGLEFNLTHSHALLLIAVTRYDAVGVDVELIREKIVCDSLARISFSAQEFRTFQLLSNAQQQQAFFNTWTRKEAFIKAVGKGIYFGLQNFSVTIDPQHPPAILEINGTIPSIDTWQVKSFTPLLNYRAAIVWQGKQKKVLHRLATVKKLSVLAENYLV